MLKSVCQLMNQWECVNVMTVFCLIDMDGRENNWFTQRPEEACRMQLALCM